MISIAAKLVELLDPFDIEADSYKDAQGRGIVERFNIAVGSDMDAELMPKLDRLVETLLDPRTAEEGYISLLENMQGDLPHITGVLSLRRKLLQYANRLYNLKGTIRSYELLFKLMGFTSVAITEYYASGGFDSPVTLDDTERRFDSGGCASCSGYDLYLTGTLNLSQNNLLAYVAIAIKMCEPINARLGKVFYNLDPVVLPTIRLYQSQLGDAMVDYGTGTAPAFTVSKEGDLLVNGNGASSTSMDTNGEVTKTT